MVRPWTQNTVTARHIAKAYSRLARRIETTMVLVESKAVKMEPSSFLSFIQQVEKDLDLILNDTEEVPATVFERRIDVSENENASDELNQSDDAATRAKMESQVHAMFRQVDE